MSKEKLKNKGITLIALIITIIVMLILTGVTLSITLGDNGLVNKAKESTTQTQVAMDRELLLSAVVGTIGNDGKVNLTAINLPEGFTGSNGTYTSKNGNTFSVSENGNVNFIEDSEEVNIELSELYGKYNMFGEDGAYIEIDEDTFILEVDSKVELNVSEKIYDEKNNILTLKINDAEFGEMEIVLKYNFIIENNEIINKIIIASGTTANENVTFGVYYETFDGLEFPLDGEYVLADKTARLTFEKGNYKFKYDWYGSFDNDWHGDYENMYFYLNGKYLFVNRSGFLGDEYVIELESIDELTEITMDGNTYIEDSTNL